MFRDVDALRRLCSWKTILNRKLPQYKNYYVITLRFYVHYYYYYYYYYYFIIIIIIITLLLLLLLTAIGLMPGGSVYKDKVHEHHKTRETENTEKHRKYMKNTHIKTLENTKNTENTIQGTINRIQETKHRKTTAYTETTKHEHTHTHCMHWLCILCCTSVNTLHWVIADIGDNRNPFHRSFIYTTRVWCG
jgi:hypothetical protein